MNRCALSDDQYRRRDDSLITSILFAFFMYLFMLPMPKVDNIVGQSLLLPWLMKHLGSPVPPEYNISLCSHVCTPSNIPSTKTRLTTPYCCNARSEVSFAILTKYYLVVKPCKILYQQWELFLDNEFLNTYFFFIFFARFSLLLSLFELQAVRLTGSNILK